MNFWHFDAGNLSVILLVAAIYSRFSIMNYQHKLLWRDYEKRYGINGKNGLEKVLGG